MTLTEQIWITGRRVRKVLRDNIGLRSREKIEYGFREDVFEVWTDRYLDGLRCVYFYNYKQLLDMFDVSPSRQARFYRSRVIGQDLVFDLTNA